MVCIFVQLETVFDVAGLPALVIVDAQSGELITSHGRAALELDPAGTEFPWYPKPLNELDSLCAASDYIRAAPVLIAFDASDGVRQAMEPLAEASIAADRVAGTEQQLCRLWNTRVPPESLD